MMAQEEPADGVDVGQQAADPEPAQATSTGGNGPGKEQSASHILNLEKHVLHADILRAGAQLVLQEPSPPKRKGKKLVSRTVSLRSGDVGSWPGHASGPFSPQKACMLCRSVRLAHAKHATL